MYWNRYRVCLLLSVLGLFVGFSIGLLWDRSSFYGVKGITRDIVVKGVHSHNDYWRSEPLIDALKAGCVSVEADVWWDGGEVYVGHSTLALENGKTFQKMYVEKIVNILREANRKPILGGTHHAVGVFATDPGQTLFLFVDFKTDGRALYGKIVKELEVLDKEGWLTWYDVENDKLVWGAVTVVATGDVDKRDVVNSERRVLFYDGELWGEGGEGGRDDIDWRVSPVASGSLRVGIGRKVNNEMNEEEVEVICGKVRDAHKRGVLARVWDTPGWPIKLRESIWDDLRKCGVDLLNVDDLKGVSEY